MGEDNNGKISLVELIQEVIKNKVIMIFSVVLFALIFLLYTVFSANHYQSKSIVFTNFNSAVKGPFGSFVPANRTAKYYLKVLDMDGDGNNRLDIDYDIDYDIDSDDASTIVFTVKHDNKDSLAPAFNKVFNQFSGKVDQFLKKEAIQRALSETKSDLQNQKRNLHKLKNNFSYLDDLKMRSVKANITKNELNELKELGISVNMDRLLGYERRVLDSVLTLTKIDMALTNSRIDSYQFFLDSISETSASQLMEGFSLSEQVLSVYRPVTTPNKPNRSDWLKRTILGGFIGLLIGFFVIFFRSVTPKTKD